MQLGVWLALPKFPFRRGHALPYTTLMMTPLLRSPVSFLALSSSLIPDILTSNAFLGSLGPGLLHNVLLSSHSPWLTPKYPLGLCLGVSCKNRWRKKWKKWQTLFYWASASLQTVTAAMKLKDACLLLGRKAMTNLKSMLKSRDITFGWTTKVHIVKAMVFPVVRRAFESWTIKKAEHWRIYAFELWCLRRLLRVPWTARSNQSILKEINPEYSLQGLMLKLKLQ